MSHDDCPRDRIRDGKAHPKDRARLAKSLPRLVPEIDGDALWATIIHDPAPRPTLTEFGNRLDAAMLENPDQFSEMTEEEFDKHS